MPRPASRRKCRASDEHRCANQSPEVTIERSFPTVLSHIFRLRLAYEGGAQRRTARRSSSRLVCPIVPAARGSPVSARSPSIARSHRRRPPACCCAASTAMPTPTPVLWHLLFEDLTDTHRIATAWPLPPAYEQSAPSSARKRASTRHGGTTTGSVSASARSAKPRSMRWLGNLDGFARVFGDRLPVERRELHQRLAAIGTATCSRAPAAGRSSMAMLHAWNCFLPDNGPGVPRLFDWDAWGINHASDDLAYLDGGALVSRSAARAFENRLLDRYHDELLAHAVTDYSRRRTTAGGLSRPVLWQIARAIWHLHVDRHPAGVSGGTTLRTRFTSPSTTSIVPRAARLR